MSDKKFFCRKKGKARSKKATENKGQLKITECFKQEKKRTNRFNGLPEEELYSRCLPDHLAENLDILIVSVIYFFA